MAFGGLLHFQVNEVLGKNDYFMAGCDGVTDEYINVLCHPVNLIKRGLFQNQTSCKELMINTLNGQGIAQPGDGQALKAVSDNDIIEGISVGDYPILAALVHQHTEFYSEHDEHLLPRRLYKAFGNATFERTQERAGK